MKASIRDGYPAVCVKDREVWARHAQAGPLIEALDESQVQFIYDGIAEDFWRDIVPDIAREHGYDPSDIFQDGRSGGWLVVSDTMARHFCDYLTSRAPVEAIPPVTDPEEDHGDSEAIANQQKFVAFAGAIEAAMEGAGEMFVERLQEAVTDLEKAREGCLVRGEN
jgi:hypothetical protein